VGGALPRPFGIELRISLIGLGQGLGESFAPRCGSGKTDPSCNAKANARSKHAPSHVAIVSGTPNHVIPLANPRPSAPADAFDTFTCLERAAATGKPPRAKSTFRPWLLPVRHRRISGANKL